MQVEINLTSIDHYFGKIQSMLAGLASVPKVALKNIVTEVQESYTWFQTLMIIALITGLAVVCIFPIIWCCCPVCTQRACCLSCRYNLQNPPKATSIPAEDPEEDEAYIEMNPPVGDPTLLPQPAPRPSFKTRLKNFPSSSSTTPTSDQTGSTLRPNPLTHNKPKGENLINQIAAPNSDKIAELPPPVHQSLPDGLPVDTATLTHQYECPRRSGVAPPDGPDPSRGDPPARHHGRDDHDASVHRAPHAPVQPARNAAASNVRTQPAHGDTAIYANRRHLRPCGPGRWPGPHDDLSDWGDTSDSTFEQYNGN